MIYYCDSSAVVKIYLEEAGTAFMRNLRRNASIGDIIINVIGGPEVMTPYNWQQQYFFKISCARRMGVKSLLSALTKC